MKPLISGFRRISALALWGVLALPSGAAPGSTPGSFQASTAAASASSAPAPTPPPGSVDSSRIRLDAGDAAGALADAELAIAKGGGADAFAARADAKRGLGRPYGEFLADYAQAAKLDPRYLDKYKGLIVQRESEEHPTKKKSETGLLGIPLGVIAAFGAVGVLCIIVPALLARRRAGKPAASDDEPAKSGGTIQTADAPEGGAKADGPPGKESGKS